MIFPFIGISGVNHSVLTNETFLNMDLSWLEAHGLHIAAGLLTTSTTLTNRLNTHHPQRFVTAGEMNEIVQTVHHPRVKYVVHHRSSSEAQLALDLLTIGELSRGAIAAIQVDEISDYPFPNPEILENFRRRYQDISLILQVGPQALNEVGNTGNLLVEKLAGYTQVIDALLLDKSDSRGIPLDSNMLRPVVQVLGKELPSYNIIVAGGLNNLNINMVSGLLSIYPKLSIDAESVFFEKKGDREEFKISMIGTYLDAYREALNI